MARLDRCRGRGDLHTHFGAHNVERLWIVVLSVQEAMPALVALSELKRR